MTDNSTPLFVGDWVLTPECQRGEVVGVSSDDRWVSVEGRGFRILPEIDGAACWDLGEWRVEQLQLIERGREGRWADQEAAEISNADLRGRVEGKPDAA